jgi:ABC-type multidrug transport system permease subunit
LTSGLLSNVLHNVRVICSPTEINIFQPPSNTTCSSFLDPFLAYAPGALYNPTATENCEYCRYGTGDEYLKTLAVGWSGRWRDFGVLWAYVAFNVGLLLLLTGLPRWDKGIKGAAERKRRDEVGK